MTTDDYPRASWNNGEQGNVGYRLEIDEKGRVTKCLIIQSSGFERLDKQSCKVLKRANFFPARDEHGKGHESTWSGTVRWKIPGHMPPCTATIENPGGCAQD